MAYSVSINNKCHQSGCTKQAVEEVFGYRNDRYGKFCSKHAKARVASLNAAERVNTAGFGVRSAEEGQ
jgi:hypothetical protein